MESNNGWWENWVDSPEEEEYWNNKIPDQRDLDPKCHCDRSYVCDWCAKNRQSI